MNLIFIGTPEFGAIILEGMVKNKYKPILVVTSPDKPVGRKQILTPPPVKEVALKYKIPLLQPEKIQEAKDEIKKLDPDIIIVAASGYFLPKEILEIPKYGCLNIHPSLLPQYRGPSPVQFTILNGDKKTGVTIMLIDERMDHGPIINQRTLEINNKETKESLTEKLADLGTNLMLETIPQWIKGKMKPEPQDETKAVYSKILTKMDGEINWQKKAEELEREVRAYFPWPGSYTTWKEKRGGKLIKIKILRSRIYKTSGDIIYPTGKTLVVPQNEIAVQCGKGLFPGGGGDLLVIEKLQMEGKKEMTAEEFLRGHPSFIGTILQ